MRFGHSTIRERFGRQFSDLGVDCFTLYVQDDWQPACYIPHEVDPYLFYPETMYTGPLCEYFQNILERLEPTEPSMSLRSYRGCCDVGLKWLVVHDTPNSWLNPNDPLEDVFPFPSFRSFVGREEIEAVAIFAPDKPIYERATHPELLFLNARREEWKTSEGDFAKNVRELPSLAKEIFVLSHEQFRQRQNVKAWIGWLHRSVRCQSQLITLMHHHLLHGEVPPSEIVYQRLLEVLSEVLPRRDRDWLATLHLFESSEEDLRLREKARLPRGSVSTSDHVCSGSDRCKLSITLCTSLVGRAHLLSHVDPPDRPSVFLTPEESRALAEEASSDSLSPLSLKQKGDSGCGSCQSDRLVLEAREPNWDEVRNRLAGPLARIYQKLRKRSLWHYGDIFAPITDEWKHDGSELCLPIVVGRQVLGCVNIESARPFFMNYGYVNMLTALSAIAGMAIARMRDCILLDNVQRTADLINSRQRRWSVSNDLNEFATAVRNHVLCDSVDFIRPNPYEKKRSRRIASSDSTVLKGYPSGADWSEYVANSVDRHVQGAKFAGVVLTIDQNRPRTVTNAIDIFASDDSTLDSNTGKVHLRRSSELLSPSNLGDRWPTKCRLLIGLRLEPENEQQVIQGRASGVVWFAYFHPARAYGPPPYSTNSPSDGANVWRLRHCIALLRATAKHCSPVPLSWSSSQIQSRTLSTDLAHSASHHSLDILRHDLETHLAGRGKLEARRLYAATLTAIAHRGLYMDLEQIESVDDLIAKVAEVRVSAEGSGYTFGLENLLQQAWDCACLEMNRWSALDLSHISLPALQLQTHKSYLFLVVFNIFTNAIKYGEAIEHDKDGALVPRIKISLAEDVHHWELRFKDFGAQAENVRKYVAEPLALGEVIKKGVPAIQWLSQALSEGRPPKFENTSRGTCWTIYIRKGKP